MFDLIKLELVCEKCEIRNKIDRVDVCVNAMSRMISHILFLTAFIKSYSWNKDKTSDCIFGVEK